MVPHLEDYIDMKHVLSLLQVFFRGMGKCKMSLLLNEKVYIAVSAPHIAEDACYFVSFLLIKLGRHIYYYE